MTKISYKRVIETEVEVIGEVAHKHPFTFLPGDRIVVDMERRLIGFTRQEGKDATYSQPRWFAGSFTAPATSHTSRSPGPRKANPTSPVRYGYFDEDTLTRQLALVLGAVMDIGKPATVEDVTNALSGIGDFATFSYSQVHKMVGNRLHTLRSKGKVKAEKRGRTNYFTSTVPVGPVPDGK